MQDLVQKKPNHYAPYKSQVAAILKRHLSTEELREFHRLSPARHFAVLIRHIFLTLLTAALIWRFPQPWIWLPLAFLQGFHILGFIILLHEHVHDAIFASPHPRWMRFLGLLYAFPSAISATQFERWHLDHHAELGSSESDPKRAYLTPKIVARWYKALYLTPALFIIYSIAAAKEAKTYPKWMQRRIALERVVNMTLHLGIFALLWRIAGPAVALRVHLVPLFFFFPIAFMLNRLGQHYDIDPRDPLKWSTLVNPSPGWNFLMLWSNLHLEHHYYPRVPFYKLAALNRKLQPMYREHGVEPRNYRTILYEWFIKNRVPHTNWFEGPAGTAEPPRSASA